ncbi:MAG TPA: ABC transporter ATP-binding protein [Ferruginibacter sp.]|nr:ABC transporter ATP-binding protein [Ferruginibacter sp.]
MKKLLQHTWRILDRSEQKKLSRIILFNVVISLADIASLALLLFIIRFYTQPNAGLPITFLPTWFIDRDSVSLIALFLLLFAIKNLFGYLIHQIQYRFVYQVASRLSDKNLAKYLNGSYHNYVTIDSSIHIRKISQEPIEFGQYVLSGIQLIITQSILIIFTVIAILLFSAKLLIILFAILLVPVLLTAYLIKERTKTARANTRSSGEKTLQYLNEAIAGFVESKIYNKEFFFSQRYKKYQQQLNVYLADLQIVQGMPNRLIEIFAVAGLFILIVIKNRLGNTDANYVITIGAFMAAAYKIIPGFVKILNAAGQVKTYEFTVKDLLAEDPQQIEKQTEEKTAPIQSLSFDNISFRYNSLDVLKDLTMHLRAGDFAGISGVSGKGKTTAINILLGFINPGKGKIFINEQETTSTERKKFWSRISYVKQQPFLLHDSILNNILLTETVYDINRVNAIVKITGLDDLIAQYPEGINKIITENGKNISGGQRQRIIIARALYKNGDLIILDEPFNELDNESEKQLLQYLRSLAQTGKLIILITHNKEGLSFCNKIISLDERYEANTYNN